MTSFQKTTALSLRKGNTEANANFTGVCGEVTVDLGNTNGSDASLGTDINTTLRVHNGIIKGGIPLARADFMNVSTQTLAENRPTINDKNLAYANLSNIERLNDPLALSKLKNLLDEYGMAYKDFSNTDTSDLAENNGHSGKNLAYADMSNVNTTDLTETGRHLGKDLAYADTSNINTANLTNSTLHNTGDNKPLAYADASNIHTEQLATNRGERFGTPLLKNDLSNIADNTLNNLFEVEYDVETQRNKDVVIYEDDESTVSGHYPTTQAVKQYINSKFTSMDFLNRDLSNATSWEMLYNNNITSKYRYDYTISTNQTLTDLNDIEKATFVSALELPRDIAKQCIIIEELEEDGKVKSARFKYKYGTTDLRSINYVTIEHEDETSDQPKVIKFSVSCSVFAPVESLGTVYLYEINNILENSSGFELYREYTVEKTNLDTLSDVERSAIDKKIVDTQIVPVLYAVAEELDENNRIAKLVLTPTEGTTDLGITSVEMFNSEDKGIVLDISSEQIYANGAGLTKIDFTNLAGMTEKDIENEQNSEWRIRHDLEISTAQVTDQTEYFRIVTAGLVQDALRAQLNSVWPIGSIYYGINEECPLQNLIKDSHWEEISDHNNEDIIDVSGVGSYIRAWLRVS